MEATTGRTAKERGFYVYELRRKVESIYIIKDNEPNQGIPDIKLWKMFLDVYVEDFSVRVAKVRNHLRGPVPVGKFSSSSSAAACGSGSVAAALFPSNEAGVRRQVEFAMRRLQDYSDLLPAYKETSSIMGDDDDADGGGDADGGVTTRRGRSDGGGIFDELNVDDSDKSFPLRFSVIAAAAPIQAQSDEGCLFTIMAEEWVLGKLVNKAFQEAYKEDAPRVFDRKLKVAFLAELKETGVSCASCPSS
jgi:hypothetical protein